ncbi:hypothetical protein, partial [Halorussus sp. GCM10023401]|uniref:hypothetical protein n=1 Tax=Halorussus sp. GCM10023401 TaxID=3252680 RepID=UPI003608ACE3
PAVAGPQRPSAVLTDLTTEEVFDRRRTCERDQGHETAEDEHEDGERLEDTLPVFPQIFCHILSLRVAYQK